MSSDINTEDLVKILTTMRMKVEYLNVQVLRMGLFNEYILEGLLAMTDDDDEPLLDLNMEGFPAWAEIRWQEIQDEAKKGQEEAAAAALKAEVEAAGAGHTLPAAHLGVDLNE